MESFDYSKCDNWCRICGVRYLPSYYNSEIGENTLCDVHQDSLLHNNYDLANLKMTSRPIKPNETTEIGLLKKYYNKN